MAAGSGTCSSISMQVTTSKPAGLRAPAPPPRPGGSRWRARSRWRAGGRPRSWRGPDRWPSPARPRARALREQAPAAADIQHATAGERRRASLMKARAHRVQQVQRPKLALRVPEAAGAESNLASSARRRWRRGRRVALMRRLRASGAAPRRRQAASSSASKAMRRSGTDGGAARRSTHHSPARASRQRRCSIHGVV